jgi:(p)ppGpp synthase/HD superfamily hydrolase
MFTLQDAIDLATFAHRHQFDKAGEPYINHPKRVLQAVQNEGARPYVQMAAVLHDVIEDTPFNADVLLAIGVPEAAVRLVEVLTVKPGQKREDYYAAIAAHGPDAVMVKAADMRDNLLPWRLSYLPVETQDRLRAKYAKGLAAIGLPA